MPYDGAIDRMTLLVDGREMPAKLLGADEARRAYEEIVRKNRDPALLEWVGTGMFKTSVFPVPPGAKRTVSLRYTQLCRKQEGMTDFLFPLSTAKYTSHPVEKIDFRVSVESQEEIKNIYSPTHAIEIKRPDDRHAVVTLHGQGPGSLVRFPPALRHWPRQGEHAGAELSARQEPGRLFPPPGQPGDQGQQRAAEEDGAAGDGPFGQHERAEDRAGPRGLEARA